MSNLASVFLDLMDPSKYSQMKPDEILQQAAWLYDDIKGTPHSKDLLIKATGLRLGMEVYNRLSGQQQIDQYRAETVLRISEFCRQHPNASEAEISKEVKKQIQLFAARVGAL